MSGEDQVKENNKTKVEELKDIFQRLTPEELAKLTDDDVTQLRKVNNPYGITLEAEENAVMCFSYTDLREKYLQKLLVTGFIGFLNRACDEWEVPDDVPVVPVYDWLQDKTLLKNPLKKTPEEIEQLSEEALKDYKLKEPLLDAYQKKMDESAEHMKKRIVVKEFLEYLFQYDPDKHVRSAYIPQPADPERRILQTPAAKLAIKKTCQKDQMLLNEVEATLKMQEELQEPPKRTLAKRDPTRPARAKQARAVVPHCRKIAARFSDEDKSITKEDGQSEPKEEPLEADPQLERNTTEMIPPADVFHRFNHYFETHYEELRDIVKDLYCEKADLERAIIPYQWFDSKNTKAPMTPQEAADKFIDKHKDEAIAAIYPADVNKWNLFGPFKEVRERVNFYNKHTQVLEEMLKQIERDGRLGRDLLMKKMSKKKKENVEADGPDSEAFTQWKKQNAALKTMGAETLEDDELPDDAIEVPIFRISKGGQQMDKGKFYTKAEAPDQPDQTDQVKHTKPNKTV